MNLTNFQWVYLLTSFFGTYTVYKFLDLFFEERRTTKWVNIGSYVLYTLIISLMFMFVNIPVILLATNLLTLYALTYNYHASIKSRLLSVFYISFIFTFVEIIVVVAMGYLGKSIVETTTIDNSLALVANKLIAYMAVLLFGNFKSIKNQVKILPLYWMSVFFIPIMSLYLVVVLYQSVSEMTPLIFISLMTVFLINVIVFYLYDTQHKNSLKLMENELLTQQNRYYENQFELMKNTEEWYSSMKHEWRNHMNMLNELSKNDSTSEIHEYIGEIVSHYTATTDRISTGNQVIDSILNFKRSEAAEKQIAMKYDLEVPEVLNIPTFDLSTILSNLIDNGMEALERYGKERELTVTIRYVKKRLLIETVNAFDGEIKREGEKLITTKSKGTGHGLGLGIVKKTVEKYNGEMHIHHDQQIFKVKILLFA